MRLFPTPVSLASLSQPHGVSHGEQRQQVHAGRVRLCRGAQGCGYAHDNADASAAPHVPTGLGNKAMVSEMKYPVRSRAQSTRTQHADVDA